MLDMSILPSPMNLTGPAIIVIIWRTLKLLFKAAWGVLGFLGLMVTLDSGWGGFAKDVQHSWLLGWVLRLWNAVVALVTQEPLGSVALLVWVALFTYLLVDRPRARSRAARALTWRRRLRP